MRKSARSGWFKSVLVILGISINFFTACEIGLGESVDTEVPVIEFAETTVESGAVVRDAFAVYGTFDDDGAINSITGNLINLTTGATYTKQGEIDTVGKTWKIIYNPATDHIADGNYDLHVSVKDSVDHETKISRSLIIDNTAPIVVLSRPSTKLGATLSSGVDSFDSYGQKFTLEGKAADDNDVSLIEVEVYDNEDCTGEPYVISLPSVPLTIESDVATFAENITNDYSQIYGHTTKSGDERRYCKLIVYDGAQRYPTDGSAQTEADRKGNSVDYYYLNSDVSLLFTNGYKITELYHILNGTYSSSASRTISTSSVITDYLNNASKKTSVGQFNLNPENSPTFVVSARNPLSSETDDFTSQTITNGNSKLEVEVSPGLDGDLLEEESIGVYLIRCNEAGQPVDSSNNVIPESSVSDGDKIWLIQTGSTGHAADADITVSGSVYKFKTKSNIGNSAYGSLVVGAYYLIRVVGHDSHNDIMNVGDDTHRTGKYGFKLETAGETINLSSVSFVPSSKTIYTWETFTDQPENAEFHTIKNSLSFSGGSGVYSVFRKYDSNDYGSPISTGITGTGYSTDTNSTNISIPFGEEDQVPPSKIYYYVKDNANLNSNERSIDISYDNTPPSVPDADIECPDVQSTQLRRISFSGSVSDTAPAGEVSSEVKSVFVQISDGTNSTPDYGQDNALMANLGGDEWSIQVDTFAYSPVFAAEGNKTVSVVARDGVKLKSNPATATFMYDTAKPDFTSAGVVAKTIGSNTVPAAVITGSYIKENFKLEATAEDTNAIDSVYVSIPKTFTSQPSGWPTNYYTDAECTTTETSFTASKTYYFKYNATTTSTANPVLSATYSTSFVTGSSNSSASNYLADGNYTFYMTVKDVAGKTHTASKTFTIDTTLPVISSVQIDGETIAADADNSSTWYRKQTIPLIINASDANISSVECQALATGTPTDAGWTPLNLDAGLYKGSAVFNGNGADQKLYIRVKDAAGNIRYFNTNNNAVIMNIDTEAPELSTLYYQVGSGTLTEAGATVYTNGTAAITVYGNYKAENSGVQALTCNLINGNTTTPISPTVTYSTTEITGLTNIPAASAWTSLPTTDAGKKAIRSYKMVFTTTGSGKLEISGYNGTYVAPAAGQTATGGKTTIKPFTITQDTTLPNLKNIRLLIDAANDTDAYKKTVGTGERYYINNTTSTALTISGVSTDNIGVDTVSLAITGITAPANNGTSSEWKFESINLSSLSGNTTATVTVTDVAGNSKTEDLIIYFDTTGPAGFHQIDSSSKDLNFRIGDADNDDVTSSAAADTDVGSKYSDGTYGNNSTIKIRGTINDTDSGVNMIYYYVFDKPIVIAAGYNNKQSVTVNSVPSYGFASNDNLRDYVITNKTGYFAPSAEEEKRVFYNVSGTDSLGGTQFTTTADSEGNYRYYKTVKTNYKSTISGFTHENNYLVIAAVDNVGNKGLDIATVGSEQKNYCQINVDNSIPDISLGTGQESIRYSNAGADITFTGRATDTGAGVKSVSFTVNGHEISKTVTTYGTVTLDTATPNTKNDAGWSLTIKKQSLTGATGNISVYGTVTDGAGSGNSQTLSVATIIMDTTPPSVTLNLPKDADSSVTGTQINGTISLSGTASDKNGLFEETTTTTGGTSTTSKNMKLYYTTSSDLNTSLTNAITAYANNLATAAKPTITPGSDAASAWKEIGAASHDTSWTFTGVDTSKLDGTTAIPDGTTVYFTVAAKDSAGNTGYSTPVTVVVDQNTDRPKVSFSNLELGSSMASTDYIWLKNTTKIIGTISDDDDDEAGTNTMQISLNGTNWNPVTLNGSSFSYDLKGLYTGTDTETQANGNKTVYFKVTDKKGKAFTSAATNTTSALYLSDGTDIYGGAASGAKAGSIVYVTVDTKYPEVVLQGAKLSSSTGDFVENYSSVKLGGTNTSFVVKFTASDTNGIDNTSVTGTADFPYGTSTDKVSINHSAIVTPTTSNPYYTMTFSLSTEQLNTLKAGEGYDGSVNIRISASDNAGNATAQTATLAYDFKPSVVSFSSPASSATLSGDVQAYGSLTESAAVYYSVSPSQTISAGGSVTSWLNGEGTSTNFTTAKTVEAWNEISDASLSWTINFDNLISSTSGTHSKSLNKYLIDYGIATQDANSEAIDSIVSSFNDFVRLYLWIKTVDSAGNEKIAVHPILVDPQGDRPSLQFSYPSVNNGTMGGKVSIYGTATDTKGSENKIGVDSVWVQIKSTTHRAAANTTTYGTFPSYDAATDTISMTLTSADLDYMADNGYSVYKMSTYNAASPASNTNWVRGSSTLAAGESAADYAALANLNGAAWDIDINKTTQSGRSEFDPPNGIETNPIVIRVFARDGDGKFSLKADRYVSFDADTPIISELKLVQSSGAGFTATASATKTYSADMYVKDVWYLTGTATDKDAIKKVTIGSDTIVDNGVVQTGWTDKVKLYNASNTEVTSYGTTVKFKYELTPASGIGSKTPVISVTDNASPQSHTGTENIVVKYDNNAPVLAATAAEGFNINSSIYQDNSWYTFGSKASEAAAADGTAQSGFAYTVFYFVRNNTVSSTKTLFDVLNPRASSAIDITGTTFAALGSETTTTDNTIVTDSGIYWYRKGIVAGSISGQTFRVNNITGIRPSSLLKIDGAFYLVTGVDTSTKTITVDTTLPSATASVAYAAIAGVVNNTIPEGEGSVIQTDGYYDSPSRDDGDRMIESVTNTGTTWKWEASVCSNNISDGPITLHYVVFDKAGNSIASSVTGNVANNAPRIASLKVWSDFNENGTEEEGESDTKYYQGKERKVAGHYTTKATGATSEFVVSGNNNDYNNTTNPGSAFMTVKASTRFIPEIIGGNGALYYSYKHGTAATLGASTNTPTYVATSIGQGEAHGIDEIVDDNGYYIQDENGSAYVSGRTDLYASTVAAADRHYMEIPGTVAGETSGTYSLNMIGNSASATAPHWFEYTIYDSTEGCGNWTASAAGTAGRLSAKFRVALNLQYVDSTRPVTVISPLYWKSATDNSVYQDVNGDLYGHVELKGDLGTSELGSTYGTDDDKVSGKVVFRGFAYDNKRITELKWGLVNNATTYTNPTYKFGSGMNAGATFSNGTWTSTATMATNHYTFEVSSAAADGAYHNQNGHKVAWTLTVDTSYISGVVGKDLRVIVQATDSQPASAATRLSTITNDSVTSTADPDEDPETYDSGTYCPTYKVDVLPYITSVSTRLARKGKSNPISYSRTALGHYPIASDETEADSVILKGFNLAEGSANVDISAGIGSRTTGAYAYTVSGTGANAITTINNMNNNDAHGAYNVNAAGLAEKTKVANMYNRQPNTNTNLTLTDDVYFDMWEFKNAATTKSGKLSEPVMKINPKNQSLGFAFANGSDSLSLPYGRNNNTAYEFNSYTNWQRNFANYSGINFVYDSNGFVHSISTGLDTEPNSGLAGYMQYIYSPWQGNGNNISNWNQNYTAALESVGIPSGVYVGESTLDGNYIDTERFGKPSIAVAGDNRLYAAYYDSDNNQIRFRIGKTIATKNSRASTLGQFSDDKAGAGSIGNDTGSGGTSYNSHTMFEAHPDYYSLLAGQSQKQNDADTRTDTGNGASEYVALDVIAGTESTNIDPTIAQVTDDSATSVRGKTITGVNNFSLVTGAKLYITFTNDVQRGQNNKATLNVNNTGVKDIYFNGSELEASQIIGNGLFLAEYDGEHWNFTRPVITNTDVVVIVWYDGNNLMYTYRYGTKDDTDCSSSGVDNKWAVPKVIFNGAGLYCAIKVDPLNGIHIAGYDRDNADLYYCYMTGYDQYASRQTALVDSYSQIGKYISLDVACIQQTGTSQYNVIPYISYYGDGFNGLPKVAYLPGGINPSSPDVPAGADSVTELFTGNWEVSLLPTTSEVNEDNMNIALWKTTTGTTGVLTTSTKPDSWTEPNITSAGTNEATWYGNGTSKFVVGYGITDGPTGFIEIGQMKN